MRSQTQEKAENQVQTTTLKSDFRAISPEVHPKLAFKTAKETCNAHGTRYAGARRLSDFVLMDDSGALLRVGPGAQRDGCAW